MGCKARKKNKKNNSKITNYNKQPTTTNKQTKKIKLKQLVLLLFQLIYITIIAKYKYTRWILNALSEIVSLQSTISILYYIDNFQSFDQLYNSKQQTTKQKQKN